MVDVLCNKKQWHHFGLYKETEYVKNKTCPPKLPPNVPSEYAPLGNKYIITDISKISLLYVQMNQIASKCKLGEKIEFNFIESKENLFSNISDFYNKVRNRQFIPDNIKLNLLLEHSGDSPTASQNKDTPKKSIQGTGKVDEQYARTSKAMFATAFCITNDQELNLELDEQINQIYFHTMGKIDKGYLNSDFIKKLNKYISPQINNKPQINSGNLIQGIFAAAGLVIGAGIGIALVATGVFAPFGVGVLGAVAAAATIGGGLAFISGALGFTAVKMTDKSDAAQVGANIPKSQDPLSDCNNASIRIMAQLGGPTATRPTGPEKNHVEVLEPKPNSRMHEVILESNEPSPDDTDRSPCATQGLFMTRN